MAAKVISLTAPTTKTKRRTVSAVVQEQPTVTGHETEVDLLMDTKKKFDDAKKAFDNARSALEPIARQCRIDAEEGGTFDLKVKMRGSKTDFLMSFGDQFTEVDISSKPDLQTVTAGHYDELFEDTQSGEVHDNRLDDLIDIIKAAGHDPDEFLTVTKALKTKDGFRRQRFEIRSQLDATTNKQLDTVIEQIEYKPTLSGFGK
jgi:hypothetical protein